MIGFLFNKEQFSLTLINSMILIYVYAVSLLQELMERPLRLRIGQKNEETGSSEPEEEDNSEEQIEES